MEPKEREQDAGGAGLVEIRMLKYSRGFRSFEGTGNWIPAAPRGKMLMLPLADAKRWLDGGRAELVEKRRF